MSVGPVDSAVSRPSLTNSVNADKRGESGSTAVGDSEPTGENEKLAEAVRRVRRSDLANRPLSVHPGRKLREELVREKSDGGHRARTVAEGSKQFLKWFNKQEGSKIVFQHEDGGEVRADLPTSYSEDYAGRQYGTLKDIERTFRRVARNPRTAMLTHTQSSENANGDPRAPADHLRELQEAWTNVEYDALRNLMRRNGYELLTESSIPAGPEPEDLGPEHLPSKWWTFAVVLEPHESGFLHAHVALFMDAGPSEGLTAEDFRAVRDRHLRAVDGAGQEAHTMDRYASVNDLGDGEGEISNDDPIRNLSSYISEYIAGYGDPVEERSAEEIVAFTAIWATGTQRVRFGNGANALAAIGLRIRDGTPDRPSPEWSVKEIERPNGDTHPTAEVGGGPEFVAIDGAPSADPKQSFPPP
jgi:hypothetical protein